jgi:uncharacterized protein
MTPPASPRDVVHRLLEGIRDQAWDRLPDLYAEDTVVEQPMARPAPLRLEGREALRRHFATVARRSIRLEPLDVRVHETGAPEVVVVEYDYDGHVARTGKSFRCANVLVVQVRDGRIVTSRDYHDHGAIGAALR